MVFIAKANMFLILANIFYRSIPSPKKHANHQLNYIFTFASHPNNNDDDLGIPE